MSYRDPPKQSIHPFQYIPSKYLANSNNSQINCEQFCYHHCQLANFIIYASKSSGQVYRKDKLLKWIAYATFCHPVLIKYAQKAVENIVGSASLLDIMNNSISNIYGLEYILSYQGFSLQLFNINKWIQLDDNLTYAKALLFNALPHLSKGKLFKQCQILLSEIPKQDIYQVRQFINQVHQIREKVIKSLTDNKFYLDNYRNNLSQINQKNRENSSDIQRINIHELDVELSKHNCLVSAQYLPQDYQGQFIQIWINKTVELNSLLGNFVCKERFGQFQYVKGPLTYAMQKGIMLVLNNFQHISNQLLVGMRTLAQQMKIFHNQKTVQARGGFKILGICSSQKMSTKMKNMVSNNQYIYHLQLPKRSVLQQIPKIQNQTNRQFIIQKLIFIQNKLGLIAARKLWKRILRARVVLIQSQQENKLWETFFTQGFKDSVELQMSDILSIIDQTRTIHYQAKYNKIVIGRTTIDIVKQPSQKIVKTQYSLSILQKLSICSELKQTPLLISQTGCGKTTLVQYLAELGGHHLYVYNMSSGTDVMDLVGGFKPIDCRSLLKELFFRFIQKFRTIPGSQKNQQYLQDLMKLYNEDQLKRLLPSLSASITKIKTKIQEQRQLKQWDQLKRRIDNIYANLSKIDSNLVFSFLEGNLIKAIRNGDWVLIDEINMATNDVLQKIVPLIQGKSLLLYQKGDLTYIERHPNFRIIACMNPANDSGKKPLPINLMQKFTPINLPEPQRMDIEMMIKQITPQLNPSEIADIYFSVKKQKTISLRNLARCLDYLNRNKDIYTFKRALYDALLLGFQYKELLKKFQDLTAPKPIKGFVQMHGFLVQVGSFKYQGEPQIFHLTQTFLQHLKDFLRAIAGTQLPVLLQGPTSAGKTSIIRYVASVSGHKCIRINNHQHTQIQQYLGNYFPDKQGKLIFREGPLVQAVRQGHWLILDELNLARTQILECLNRLLDDNRQLFIPQQQMHIKPHKNFRIFATQNPASYSGRKTLSRAFRNRFISLSFDDITIQDTMAIMKVRRPILNDSKQLSNYVKKTLQSLQNYRQKQRVFSKDSVITIRDLLKWTGRKFSDKDSFMRQGYALLTQRLRTTEQKKFVQNVLFSGSKNEDYDMFRQYQRVVDQHLNQETVNKSKIYVQMNKSFKRMAALTLKAVLNNQAVLLVGETGCGKTTLAQLLASISGRKFYSINCHKHTQASDLLGCLRPCIKPNSLSKFQFVNGVVIDAMLEGAVLLIDQINTAQDSVLQRLNQVLQSNNIGVERGEGWQTVTAKEGFCIIATMNPSGDYGKKQLSPALRNRFTQIWVQPITHPQYIESAEQDIRQMIVHKLAQPNNQQVFNNASKISSLIFNFIREYNCKLAPKYSLTRKLLTMRDIGWVCKFMSQCNYEILNDWQDRYYWALKILAIQGVNFMMGDLTDSLKLNNMKQELNQFIKSQVSLQTYSSSNSQIEALSILKQLTFPLLIKTDLPLQLLGIKSDERIFFSPHTELTDLLGQFRPKGTQFIWQDQTLLKTVKNGERVALMDLNLAQQPVIQGINSLFDHRGSIFVVELNQMFIKHHNFRPIVVLKQTDGTDRRGLPNSFLNRFIKIRVKDVPKQTKINYLKQKYGLLLGNSNQFVQSEKQSEKLWSYISTILQKNPKVKIQILQYLCSLFSKGQSYMWKGIQILNLTQIAQNKKQSTCLANISSEQKVLKLLPLYDKPTNLSTSPSVSDAGQNRQVYNTKMVINSYITLKETNFSVCLIGSVNARQLMVKRLGYLLNRNVVKVILSTMTDMADLLGSYEQVDDQQQPQSILGMQQQLSQREALNRLMSEIKKQNAKYCRSIRQTQKQVSNPQKQSRKTNNSATNFKYVKSRIIRTLQQEQGSNLLYIQVPSEALLQRVEKGIKAVYEQKVNVIVGIDPSSNSANICSNTKFIPIVLKQLADQKAGKQNIIQLTDNQSISLNNKAKTKPNSSEAPITFFRPNYSNLVHWDVQIRVEETLNWINKCCGDETNRNLVKAWQRLYNNVKNDVNLYQRDRAGNDSQRDWNHVISNKINEVFRQLSVSLGFQKQYNKLKQQDSLPSSMQEQITLSNSRLGQIEMSKQMQQYISRIKQFLNMPSSKQQYKLMRNILQILNNQSAYWYGNDKMAEQKPRNSRKSKSGNKSKNNQQMEEQQNQNCQIMVAQQNQGTNQDNHVMGTVGGKFKYIYLTDSSIGGFRQQSKKLLSLCYNAISSICPKNSQFNYDQLLQKLTAQTQHMYTATCNQYHNKIVIKYSEQEYKTIPIIPNNCLKSLYHYILSNMPYSITKLAGLQIDYSLIAKWEVQRVIVQYVEYAKVDFMEVGRWLWSLDIRDLAVFQILKKNVIRNKLDYWSKIGTELHQKVSTNGKLWHFMLKIIQIKNTDNSHTHNTSSPLLFAYTLFHSFKPEYTHKYKNLHPHIQTESQLKSLKILAQQDLYYKQAYNRLCEVKYSKYKPNSYKILQNKIEKYLKQYQQIQAKKYIYRGYDNLRLLKQFYQELVKYCQSIEESQFNNDAIRNALLELYKNYYHDFKDILWPILVSLIIIHSSRIQQKTGQIRSFNDSQMITQKLLKQSSQKSFQKALNLILHKQQQQFYDAAKNYTKYQRKFKNTVIMDQYTDQAVKKHKENEQQQFKQFFGKSDNAQKSDTILDQLYMLVRKRTGCKYVLKLIKQMFSQMKGINQFIINFELKFNSDYSSQKIDSKLALNIYQQYSVPIVHQLSLPLPKILQQAKKILSNFNIDSIKIIGSLCNKIQQHKVHQEVYKILIDCQFLITKIYEGNSVLPARERIQTQQLQNLCLNVRRIELKNWKSLLDVKINRIQKADTLQFMHFYRNFVQIGNIGQSQSLQAKECFRMCDDFMRQSKISCYQYRLYLLTLTSQNIDASKPQIKHNLNRIINFYSSLKQPIMEFWSNIKKQKIKQVSEYQKLAKWDSNRYLIFRQGCEKFQKKIHHILKRYQQELSMQVGVFHTNLRAKHICQSVQQYGNVFKIKQEAQRLFKQTQNLNTQQNVKQNINNFEGIAQKIFQCLQQIKQQQHNTQSKMLLIRNNLAEIQQIAEDLPSVSSHSSNLQSQVLVEQMFPDDKPQFYKKATKYYFGMWDKLCQKTQTAWNREIVQRVWSVVQKIWININSRIPKYDIQIQAEIDEETDNILIVFNKFLAQNTFEPQAHHPIFVEQFKKIKQYLKQKQNQYLLKLDKKYKKMQNPEQTLCLMKIGYILSSIALNLQKNGLCVKQNQQQGQQSGTQEVGDGVGIGQGEAHQGAQNVGDQIQFQQQVQGNKDQQKNKDQNADKKQQNDIQMQGDFQGDMYSKQQQQEGDDQQSGQQKQDDQKMGSVDNQQRQKDMKNDEGKAQGSEEADVQIDGQQQGSEQLVDNQQQQKQARKNQKRQNQQSQQNQQQNKSDWDDNNQQGQKINKQKEGQADQQEQQDGENQSNDGSGVSISEDQNKDNQDNSGQEQNQGENQDDSKMKDQNQDDQQNLQQGNKQGEMVQQSNQQQQPEDEPQQSQDQQKQKKFKTKRTNMEAFGRSDLNSNNPLKNNQNQPQNQQQKDIGGAAEAQGANQGQKGTGDPIHSLSAQLLKQIQNLERVTAKQNANFMKDLNVIAHDSENQQIEQNNANQDQQFQLTEQQNKVTTNLPAFLDSDDKKMQQQKQKKQAQNQKQRNEQKLAKKQKQQKTDQTKNKSKLQKSKKVQNKQEIKSQQTQQINKVKNQQQNNIKNKDTIKQKRQKNKIQHQKNVLQINHQQYLKLIVNNNTKNSLTKRQQIKDQNEDQQEKNNVMSEAFQISKILEEQLKSVLQPMDNAQYRGDYKTGKKLNLKKIIPFIASNFRKDKIWLRRTEPSQRNYFIMLALDDTKSMKHGEVGLEALKGLLAISLALQHLSIKTCITGIRDSMNIYKNFQGLLEPQKIINSFDFSHQSKVSHDLSIASFMEASLEQFKKSQSCQTGIENKQLCFIISDGKMNKDYVRPYLRQAKKRDIIYVFIIVDSEKASILTTKSVSIDQNGKVKMKLYMTDFPFEYFLIVRNVRQLGEVLATTLLQFIQQK